jgi:hypothetical protein
LLPIPTKHERKPLQIKYLPKSVDAFSRVFPFDRESLTATVETNQKEWSRQEE